MAKILIVEDDVDLSAMVADWLVDEHYTVESTGNGEDALEMLRANTYDLVVLDWDLPELAGIEILRRYRLSGGKSPVIMLTGKGELSDKEKGFDAGADDYLPKPFAIKELGMRVRALLRRAPTTASNELQARDLVLDTVKHRLTRNSEEIRLLPRDFALLEFFMRYPDEIFSPDTILSRVWHQDSEASQEGLRVAIRRIRKAVDISSDLAQSIIENVPRVGYRLRR